MLRVGLTGSLACGKSTVAKMLEARGAHVLYADHIARQLMQPGQPVYAEVVKHFGRDIVQPDGAINRQKLAEQVFGSGRIEELNRLVHPPVIAHQKQWMAELSARDPNGVAVVEAALILETGIQGRFDKIIVVVCTPEQRVQRFAARAKINLESARKEVERRMAAQMPQEQKIKAADYVIENSGSLQELEGKVEDVYRKLGENSC